MSDEDMNRRGDARRILEEEGFLERSLANLNNLPAMQVAVKPLDLSYVQKHAFLAGVVAARNVPPSQPCSGPLLWLDYDPGDNPALSRIRSALTAQPSPDVAALVALMPEVIASLDATGCNISLGRDLRAALARVEGGAA